MGVKQSVDQIILSVNHSYPPQRIVSLVPSQTELLVDLGLEEQIVGITKFCIHPPQLKDKKVIIGGTKKFWFDVIDELKPDLIIGNKEENYKEGINQLKEKHPVWISDIYTLEDALHMIEMIGDITAKVPMSQSIVQQIRGSFQTLQQCQRKSVLYLIWKNPWMAAGSECFIHNMLEKMGLINCLSYIPRYPQLTDDKIRSLKPDLIFLSSEPFPFKHEHIKELQELSPTSQILLVDGEMFSWYGSRLIQAPRYLKELVLGIGH